MPDVPSTPAQAGFAMPAEWGRHAGCLMSWPTRDELWQGRRDEAERDYAAVARAIAEVEPVVMVCRPGSAREVVDRCGAAVQPLEVPIDDSWARDNGPIFVRNAAGQVAVVRFGFNAWGERWHPYADDARLPLRIAEHLGMPVFEAPFVLEGGAFLVDGEGTLLTTEQCLLDPNRNPTLSREQIEQGLRDYLGVTTVVWLPFGHSLDVGPAGTDGHVDGVAQYLAPGRVLLEVSSDPGSPDHDRGLVNLARLQQARDARGRSIEVTVLDPGTEPEVSYANHYLANGIVVVPVGTAARDSGSGGVGTVAAGSAADEAALGQLRLAYPDREVVAVPGTVLAFGGGGPHCITQQIPEGDPAPATGAH